LVLIAVRDQQAVVVSDGALMQFMADGTTRRKRNDCRKFRIVGSGFVVAATGCSWLISRIYRHVELVAAEPGGETFVDLARFLADDLPRVHEESECRIRGTDLAGRPNPGAAVALVGFDTQMARARLIAFDPGQDYRPIELSYTALGVDTSAARPHLESVMNSGIPWDLMPQALGNIITEISMTHEFIGGELFAAVCGDVTRAAPTP
jgi:hypothetical protein